MGMDIWNSVTLIGAPEDLDIETLPDFELWDGDNWNFFDSTSWVKPNGEVQVSPGNYQVTGTGRYDNTCAIEEWAREYTAAHPEVTVTYFQEWYENDQGSSSDVYRGGELVREESLMSGMVPLDLAKLLDEAKAALMARDEAAAGQPGINLDHLDRITAALRALVEGLSQ